MIRLFEFLKLTILCMCLVMSSTVNVMASGAPDNRVGAPSKMPPQMMPMDIDENTKQAPDNMPQMAPSGMERGLVEMPQTSPEQAEQVVETDTQSAEVMGEQQQIPFAEMERNFKNMQMFNQEQQPKTIGDILPEYLSTIISLVLLIFAFVFVKLYKRKRY